jgi:peroxiredoxin
MASRTWTVVVAQVLLCAAVAWAQDTASSSSPATKPGGTNLRSFAAIQTQFNKLQEQSQKAVEKQRLEALRAFLPKAPQDEREITLATIVQLTSSLEMYDQTMASSEQFLKEFPKSDGVGAVRRLRLEALAETGKLAEARKDWDTFVSEPKPEQMRDVLESGIQLAEAYLNRGDVKAARSIYEAMATKLPLAVPENQREMFVQQLKQNILTPRMDALDQIGQAPPAIEGKDLAGNPVDLSKYHGKVVLLDFWATWCRPCMAALPEVREVYQKLHERGFDVIGLSLDTDEEQLKEFLKNQDMPWPQVWDNQGQPGTRNPFGGPNSRRYNLKGIPASFLLDRDGRIARVNVQASGLEDAVTQALARPATQPASRGTTQPTAATTESGKKP